MRKAILILTGVMLTSAAYAMPIAPVQPDGLAISIAECRADEGNTLDDRGNCVFDNLACYRRCLTQKNADVGWCRRACRYYGN
jgi:hypothetical protein